MIKKCSEIRRSGRNREILGLALFILSSLAIVDQAGAAANLVFSGGVPDTQSYYSDGVTELRTDGSFFFELGVFADGFVPTAENTDEWLTHWVMAADSSGDPLPGARTEYTTLTVFEQEYDGFTSSIDLEHNEGPFIAGTQGFLWGFDEREAPGTAEWILVTNSTDWKLPSAVAPSSQTWSLGAALVAEAVVGTQVGNAFVTGEVVIPGAVPVPEPSGGVLLVLAGVLFSAQRRRVGG